MILYMLYVLNVTMWGGGVMVLFLANVNFTLV